MPPTQPPLSTILPPLILGGATFNHQFNASVSDLPILEIIRLALNRQICAFDTSPYYGPSETLLGTTLSHPSIATSFPRSSYLLLTKVGRISANEFDYSPAWIRQSVAHSMERLNTMYLDVVYAHDVEFVSAEETLQAVQELRRIRDEEGTIKCIGISGYPLNVLGERAAMILEQTGEPLDVVMSYAHFTVQNETLGGMEGIGKLKAAKVEVVPNASLLGMGLLRSQGVPIGGMGDFHPAPEGLRKTVHESAKWLESKGERLEVVAVRWALEEWVRKGGEVGGKGKRGVSVVAVSSVEELEEILGTWKAVCDGLEGEEGDEEKKQLSIARRKEVKQLVDVVRLILRLGEWKDYSWPSPEEGYVHDEEDEEDAAAKHYLNFLPAWMRE